MAQQLQQYCITKTVANRRGRPLCIAHLKKLAFEGHRAEQVNTSGAYLPGAGSSDINESVVKIGRAGRMLASRLQMDGKSCDCSRYPLLLCRSDSHRLGRIQFIE